MTPSEILTLAKAACVTLPLAMLSAADDSTRWLAILTTASTLGDAVQKLGANTDLRRDLRERADTLAGDLRAIQSQSFAEQERLNRLAA